MRSWLVIFACIALIICENDAKRVRVRTRPIQAEQETDADTDIAENENRPQQAIQYYSAEPRQQQPIVLVSSDDEYNGLYGQQQSPARARADYNRPSPTRTPTQAPRTKEQSSKAPPVQTIRNYSKVNDDGSFTFGYEAADGSFKEETRGTDCVVRGKYGYVDPDGNKREFTYVSGNPCDPNNPDGSEEEPEKSEEESNEPENLPQNYPKQRPVVRPIHRAVPTTTNRPTTTVFQNTYSHSSLPTEEVEEEEEEEHQIQYVQQQRQRVTPRPFVQPAYTPTPQAEVNIRQRPRISLQTTQVPATAIFQTSAQPVSITPRPTYRAPVQTLQTQPPATTYRPQLQFASVTQRPATPVYTKLNVQSLPQTTPNSIASSTKGINYNSSPIKGPIDFAAEFQKFQQEHNVIATSTQSATSSKPYKTQSGSSAQKHQTNPIYESQLVFDPATGQYDSALYQQLPQTNGDFSVSQRIQPYVQQAAPQLVSLEQLQQQSPLYRQQQHPQHQQQHQLQQQQTRPAIQLPQFSQQIYQKQQENIQVLNSQQLFAQQQELQQHQLHQDRVEAAKNAPHRFQLQQQPQTIIQPQFQRNHQSPQAQSFYYIQPSANGQQQQSAGPIDAFLRGHNIEY